MKINASYEVRGQRVHRYTSIPVVTVDNLTKAVKHLTWIAGQTAPEIEISEG